MRVPGGAGGLLRSPYFAGALVAVGLLARFSYYLARPSYWYDEAFLLIPVFETPASGLLGPTATQTVIPPVFLWLLKAAYLLGGPGELSMRLPAFAAGVLGLLLLVPAAVALVGRPAGYWAAGLGALCHHALLHGAEVRPYSTDLLATVLALAAARACLGLGDRPAGWRAAPLLALALVLPGLSFTSAFALAAASLALLAEAAGRGGRGRWALWLALNGCAGAAGLAVWYFQARHLYYPGLTEHWRVCWDGFPPDRRPLSVALWSARRAVGVAHYAGTGLGVPLLALAAWGAVVAWRRSRPVAVLLAGPAVLTYLAALAERYPFSDRTVFFLAPCVWCLAAAGLEDLWRRAPGPRAALVPAAVLAALLAVAAAKTVKDGLRPEPRLEYRGALAYLHDNRAPADEALVWCRHLNEVYYGHVWAAANPSFDEGTPPAEAAARVSGRRLWVVAPENLAEGLAAPFRALAMRETLRLRFLNVSVVRLDPPAAPDPRPTPP